MKGVVYGPIREIDGIRYRVRLAWTFDQTGLPGCSRWELTRLTETGAAVVEAHCFMTLDDSVLDAERRLLGI